MVSHLELSSDSSFGLDRESGCDILWKVSDWFPNGREEGASFASQPFFLLDNLVIRTFRLKDRLIIQRAVMYVVYGRMCFWAARGQPRNYWLAIFLETAAG